MLKQICVFAPRPDSTDAGLGHDGIGGWPEQSLDLILDLSICCLCSYISVCG